MVRPIVLMAEVEPPEGLSSRKLVLETGKFNVITAYSLHEAIETLETFPKVHAIVLHSGLCKDGECESVLSEAKTHNSNLITIAISPSDSVSYKAADYTISSHEPQELLNLLRRHLGDPRMPEEERRSKKRKFD